MNGELWTVNYELRSMNCERWSMKCELWTVTCELWSMNCELWTVKCEIWTVNYEPWIWSCFIYILETYEMWTVNCGVWAAKCEWTKKIKVCNNHTLIPRFASGIEVDLGPQQTLNASNPWLNVTWLYIYRVIFYIKKEKSDITVYCIFDIHQKW